jgi:RNA polymerase sigma-70 factor, ECF subfamily
MNSACQHVARFHFARKSQVSRWLIGPLRRILQVRLTHGDDLAMSLAGDGDKEPPDFVDVYGGATFQREGVGSPLYAAARPLINERNFFCLVGDLPMNSVAAHVSRSRNNLSASRIGRASEDTLSTDHRERFNRVVLPHLSDAYSLARWLTGSPTDSEDVVQEACLRAYRGIGSFINGNARAWVLTIVRHTAYSWLQRNRAAVLVFVDDLEAVEDQQVSTQESNSLETELITQDRSMRLQVAINTLPTPFREALVLRDIQDLNYRQIAEVTGVSIGTVMSRLARARGRLITVMRAIGYGGFDTVTGSTAT